ncbi:MAG: thioredoxin domain-containing protein [Chloroflexi bacterium]|nr:thioredoxin domain-containing protein [Chloroflexota bacterium]MBI3339436.1 thioredoxin domain-containing protein [Chloroflexota bacterium]
MNRLANSTSPYLLQHAHNPVDWYPWGEEALAKARTENKPIFLSIGYAACHWCHVMAHESFENIETAAYMNKHFICIKVDREERPDLDNIYMQATTAMTGSGGWPMSVFLTPDLRPFYAGTYFPPVKRYNMPSFSDVLSGLVNAWQNEHDEIERVGNQISQHLQQMVAQPDKSNTSLTQEDLTRVTASITGAYDWGYGGWGDAPKFPQPMTIEFLLRQIDFSRFKELGKLPAIHALKSMARGGMYDVVGGGFSRYSTDSFWRIPHFEKMLYDNAQLALAYLHAWQITDEPYFKRIAIETLDFVAREMTHPDGGFYSSLDADSEGEEGKFYVWTKEEIGKTLADDSDFEFFAAAYGITEKGNWEGKTVLQRAMDDATLAARFNINEQQVADKLTDCHSRLLTVRASRVRPGTDDKVLTAWNGLMLHAFAEAARFVDDKQKATEYLILAARNADFLLANLYVEERLRRSWRNGQVTNEVFLEDYAALIIGLIELYQTDFNNRWFVAAQKLANEMIAYFSDPEGSFFDTPQNGESLLIRPKDIQDNATPSGNALACEALLKLASFTDKAEYRDLAEKALRLIADSAMRYPMAFARWLSAAHRALDNGKQVAILFDAGIENAQAMLDVIRSAYRPNVVIAASPYPPPTDAPALLAGRPVKDGKATAYVCEHFVCKQPATTPEELRTQL